MYAEPIELRQYGETVRKKLPQKAVITPVYSKQACTKAGTDVLNGEITAEVNRSTCSGYTLFSQFSLH